jgi:hypothetical protein
MLAAGKYFAVRSTAQHLPPDRSCASFTRPVSACPHQVGEDDVDVPPVDGTEAPCAC